METPASDRAVEDGPMLKTVMERNRDLQLPWREQNLPDPREQAWQRWNALLIPVWWFWGQTTDEPDEPDVGAGGTLKIVSLKHKSHNVQISIKMLPG